MKADWIALHLLGAWSAELSLGTVILRLLLSLVLSAVIGCERSSKRHSAGLRTFIWSAWRAREPCSWTST